MRARFSQDPLSGRLFVFFSRRGARVRVLYWDRDGYVPITKRLEKGTFRVPWREGDSAHVHVEAAELMLILEGIERGPRQRQEHGRPKLPEGLERKVRPVAVPAAQRACPRCAQEVTQVDTAVTERLEKVPAYPSLCRPWLRWALA